jgi:PAS domain S-box-containing protein
MAYINEEIVALICDDDESILKVTSTYISKHVKTITARDGEEAYELFLERRPDIIVTDLYMPKLDGLELTEKIKELDENVKIVIMSAFDESASLLKAIDLGVESYLVKPFQRKQIDRVMLKTIQSVKNEKSLYMANQHNDALLNFFIVTKTDENGNITFVNDKFCEISGYSRDELIGNKHSIVRHEDMKDEVFEELWSTIKEKKVWQGVVKNRAKDGSEFVARSTIFPILDEDGEISEFMAIREDVTELEKLRLEREAQREKIQKAEEDRRVLQEINSAKDSFLILFTHELKTPLNSITNFSEYLLKNISKLEKLDINKIEYLLKSIKANSTDIYTMVNSILDIAKIRSNKMQVSKEHFLPRETIEYTVEKFRLDDRAEEVDIELDLKNEQKLLTDCGKFTQIVNNIISNALKYGNGKVSVRDYQEDGAYNLVIEDDGDGIKEKAQVFELFGQDSINYLNKSKKGTGVGLYLVKLLSDLLGFEVEIGDSEKLGGAKVHLKKGGR